MLSDCTRLFNEVKQNYSVSSQLKWILTSGRTAGLNLVIDLQIHVYTMCK